MQQGPLGLSPKTMDASMEPALLHLQSILLAYYRSLSSSPHIADERRWPLQALSSLFSSQNSHPNKAVKLLSIECFAIQTRMGEDDKISLMDSSLGSYSRDDVPLIHGYQLSGNAILVDGWCLRFLEHTRVETWQESRPNFASASSQREQKGLPLRYDRF